MYNVDTHMVLLQTKYILIILLLCKLKHTIKFVKSLWSHKQVVLIGFKKNTFKAVLVYLYTDQFPDQLTRSEMLSVIEVANFLCLPRLVALAEQRLVQSFQGDATGECDIGESISCLLETCKVNEKGSSKS